MEPRTADVRELHAKLQSTNREPPVWRALEGPEGARGPGCGAGGRWRGLAGLRDGTSPRSTAGATGVEGAGGSGGHGRASRSTTPSRRLACGDLAGGRARRRPEHQRRRKQQAQSRIPAVPPARTARGRAAAHGHTEQPGPQQDQTAPETPAAPQAPPNGEASELLVVLRVLVGLAAVGAAKCTDRRHLLG